MVDTAFDANPSPENSCKSWISKGASGTFWGMSQRRSQIRTDPQHRLGLLYFSWEDPKELPTKTGKTGSRALWSWHPEGHLLWPLVCSTKAHVEGGEGRMDIFLMKNRLHETTRKIEKEEGLEKSENTTWLLMKTGVKVPGDGEIFISHLLRHKGFPIPASIKP